MGLFDWLVSKPLPEGTFAVDKVAPATEPRPTERMHEALRRTVPNFESCSDYHHTVLSETDYHPLLAAVYTAFSEHRPLVLTPDAVWLTIAQGVAQHMAIHGERLRERFVAHQGRLELNFSAYGWVEGSPENPWSEAFAAWADGIRKHVGDELHDLLACDFSTSGPIELAASRVVMMDVFEKYFQYVVTCICGIPTVTLEGTVDDWKKLADKAAGLAVFDLDWWLPHLLPICGQFVEARRGNPDLAHWQDVCKLKGAYGGAVINGWIAKLFPYLRTVADGPADRRNPIFQMPEIGFQTSAAPSGLSQVPFVHRNAETGVERRMEAVGGLVGVSQDPQTLALKPMVGWAVRRSFRFDALVAKVVKEHHVSPDWRGLPGTTLENGLRYSDLPADLQSFYHTTNGCELFGRADEAKVQFVPLAEFAWIDFQEEADPDMFSRYKGRTWHRFARLQNGGWLAIDLDPYRQEADRRPKEEVGRWGDHLFAPVCLGHGPDPERAYPGENPVVALRFMELLERLLGCDGGGRLYWEEADFKSYGDAENFTRRKS